MKQKLFFTILFSCIYAGLLAQKLPIIKVYAYSQAVLQGAKPGNNVEEGGKEIKTVPEKKLNYLFYAEQKKSTVINIISVWIKGKNYSTRASLVAKTPVEMRSDDPASGSTTLVPKSLNKIILITPSGQKITKQKPSPYLSKAIRSSELIIVYKWNGKIYYSEVKKIKELKSVAAV